MGPKRAKFVEGSDSDDSSDKDESFQASLCHNFFGLNLAEGLK